MGCVMGKRCTRELLDHILYYILFKESFFKNYGWSNTVGRIQIQ